MTVLHFHDMNPHGINNLDNAFQHADVILMLFSIIYFHPLNHHEKYQCAHDDLFKQLYGSKRAKYLPDYSLIPRRASFVYFFLYFPMSSAWARTCPSMAFNTAFFFTPEGNVRRVSKA